MALRLDLMESWAKANYTHPTIEGTAQRNAEALGKVAMLDHLIEELESMTEATEGA